MYEDFHVTDRWTGEDLHCTWKANIVAIATRHADAIDVRLDVNGPPHVDRAAGHGLGCEQKKRSGKVITDQLAAQIAGRYLKQIIEEGYDSARELYTMTVEEVLAHLDAGRRRSQVSGAQSRSFQSVSTRKFSPQRPGYVSRKCRVPQVSILRPGDSDILPLIAQTRNRVPGIFVFFSRGLLCASLLSLS